MRQIILSTILFFLFSVSYGQKIEFNKGRYYLDNQKISITEVKTLLKKNRKALDKFETGRTKSTMGIVLFTAGAGLLVTDVVTAGNTFGASYPTIKSAIGAVFCVVSIPIYINHNKKIREGIEIYNNDILDKKTSLNYNVIYNQNGIGLTMQF